jgi:hypothetical protein
MTVANITVTKEWIEENYVRGDLTFVEMMKILGLTKSSTCRYFKKIGIVKRRIRSRYEITKDLMIEMYINRLMSVEDIASEIGCSVGSIKSACSVFGLKRGSAFQRTDEWRRKCSIPHSDEAKQKMSLSKIKLNGQYHRGRWGSADKAYVHRRIAEESLGRKLSVNEVVHHKDRDRQNNHPSNLIVLQRDAHQALHIVLQKRPELEQEAWLAENCFEFEEVKNGNYQDSATYQRWHGQETCGESLG